jgi:hypothetical protein
MGAVVELSEFRKSIGYSELSCAERFENVLRGLRALPRYEQCCVCKWNKGSVNYTLVRDRSAGGHYTFDNVLPLCPNHDVEFKSSNMTDNELYYVQEFLWTICNELAPFRN